MRQSSVSLAVNFYKSSTFMSTLLFVVVVDIVGNVILVTGSHFILLENGRLETKKILCHKAKVHDPVMAPPNHTLKKPQQMM